MTDTQPAAQPAPAPEPSAPTPVVTSPTQASQEPVVVLSPNGEWEKIVVTENGWHKEVAEAPAQEVK